MTLRVLKSIINWFFRPSQRFGWGVFFLFGGIAGTLLWVGLNRSMEQTNTIEFCISCHEMQSTAYAEYTESIHYKNASGIRAICSDCHVPKEWFPKLIRKITATRELYYHFAGTIDTAEKYENKRLEMAERVWAILKNNDSRECRDCHSYEAMDFHKQRRRSAEKMQEAMRKTEETCIDCHKGIAHKLPDSDDEDDD